MTGKEILGAMIAGLQKEWVKVDMDDWCYTKDDVCFGCAATNTVCQLVGKPLTSEYVEFGGVADSFVGIVDFDCFLQLFETAIESLRCADLHHYNQKAKQLGIATLPGEPHLVELDNDNWRENLKYYIDYYNSLP